MATDNKFAKHTWNAEQQHAKDVYHQEGSTTIVANHIWETPYITQAYSATSGCKYHS